MRWSEFFLVCFTLVVMSFCLWHEFGAYLHSVVCLCGFDFLCVIVILYLTVVLCDDGLGIIYVHVARSTSLPVLLKGLGLPGAS